MWLDLLSTEMSTWTDILIREESNRTLKRSDLDMVLDLIDVLPVSFVAAEQPGLSPERIENVIKAFYASIFSTVILSAYIEKLIDPEVRNYCRIRIADEIAMHYEKVSICYIYINSINIYFI